MKKIILLIPLVALLATFSSPATAKAIFVPTFQAAPPCSPGGGNYNTIVAVKNEVNTEQAAMTTNSWVQKNNPGRQGDVMNVSPHNLSSVATTNNLSQNEKGNIDMMAAAIAKSPGQACQNTNNSADNNFGKNAVDNMKASGSYLF